MDLTENLSSVNISKETPLSTKIFAANIDNTHTEFVISYFTNKINYIITQFGKIGNLYSVETEQVQNGVIAEDPVYNIRSLLGADSIEVEAAVRYIAEQLDIKKPLVISLTLKSYRVAHIKLIVKAIQHYKA